MPIETTDGAGNTATTYALASGQFFAGTVGVGGDHDWLRISLVAGQQYSFAMVGTGPAASALTDTFLTLRNASGTFVLSNDDSGPGFFSNLVFTATTTGTYYLDARSYYGSDTGGYTVSMTTGARPIYNTEMIAGDILRPHASWSAPPAPVTVTWSARTDFVGITDAQGNATSFAQLDAAEITAVQSCLQNYSDVSGIQFVQLNPGGTSNNATMRFSNYYSTTDGAGAFADYPTTTDANDVGGDVQFNTQSIISADMLPGGYSYFASLHEIGHALGLAHPGDYNAAPGVDITYAAYAQFIQDSQQYAVMSYFDESNTGATFLGGGYAQTLMMGDIYAAQLLYGVNTSIRAGTTVYGFQSTLAGSVYDFATNSTPNLCIWDGGGIDTIDVSGFSVGQRIDLGAGRFSNVGGGVMNVSIAVGAIIENAIGGSASDRLYGNSAANRLTGNGGNDTLTGNGGNDVLIGGTGNDRFVFNAALSATTNVDTIKDVTHDQDIIALDNAVMAGLGLATGALSAAKFYAAAGATHGHDSTDRIIYDTTSGKLYYDGNGSAAGGVTQIAILSTHPTIDAGDFLIV